MSQRARVAVHAGATRTDGVPDWDNPPSDDRTYEHYGHTNIQYKADVLADMKDDAKKVGVRFK